VLFCWPRQAKQLKQRLCRHDCSETITSSKEEERKRRHSEWMQYVTAKVLRLVKLITSSLENVSVNGKRIDEKITVARTCV
jgi:predicted nucleic acid-binding Zn ribbon protein